MRQSRFLRSPERMVVGGFALTIVVGTALLMLPISYRGASPGPLDAFFTSTSAVCVTGLVVVDTGAKFTVFGQLVILFLMQIGGLGVMTYAALAFYALGKRLSLEVQSLVEDSFFRRDFARDFKRTFIRILCVTGALEFVGALLLFTSFVGRMGVGRAAFSAVFHAVSAFCNAGFSIYSDSLTGFRHSPFVLTTIAALIVVGGLGHPVVFELLERGRARFSGRRSARGPKLGFHTRVVLVTSAVLTVGGALMVLTLGLTPAESSFAERAGGALFQSVSARTAGFNTVEIGALPTATLVVIAFLMFVGGSPGSCAGGIKTTTFATWFAALFAGLRGRDEATLLERRLSPNLIRRVHVVIGLAAVWNLFGVVLLMHTETGARLRDVFFEQLSAFGTVGLSTGLTPGLSAAGRLWIAASMFFGRLGPLTLATWIVSRQISGVKYPEGKVMIG